MDTKINLCDTCVYSVPDCLPNDIEFGDGFGNDNVIKCNQYMNDKTGEK